MKLLFALLFSITALMANSTPASDNEMVKPEVMASFRKNFASAQEVSWMAGDAFYKAQFVLYGQHLTAFFSTEGHLIGLSKNIAVEQLPLLLQTDIKNKMHNAWISELIEVSNDEGTTYYITLEDGDEKTTYRSTYNNWTLFQKKPKP